MSPRQASHSQALHNSPKDPIPPKKTGAGRKYKEKTHKPGEAPHLVPIKYVSTVLMAIAIGKALRGVDRPRTASDLENLRFALDKRNYRRTKNQLEWFDYKKLGKMWLEGSFLPTRLARSPEEYYELSQMGARLSTEVT